LGLLISPLNFQRTGSSGCHQPTAMWAAFQADTHQVDPQKRAIEGLPTARADCGAPNAVLNATIFVVLWVLICILLHQELDAHTYRYNPANQEQDLERGLVGLPLFPQSWKPVR